MDSGSYCYYMATVGNPHRQAADLRAAAATAVALHCSSSRGGFSNIERHLQQKQAPSQDRSTSHIVLRVQSSGPWLACSAAESEASMKARMGANRSR